MSFNLCLWQLNRWSCRVVLLQDLTAAYADSAEELKKDSAYLRNSICHLLHADCISNE